LVQPAGSARQTYSAGTYFVQLQDKPVTTYSRTAPALGERLNTRTEAVRDYLGRLKRQRDNVLDAVGGVRPFYDYQLLLNGFAAKLTTRQANELARTSGVVSLVRNETRRPAETAVAATTEVKSGPAVSGTGTAKALSGTPKARSGSRTTKTASAAGVLPPADTAAFLGLKNSVGLYSKFPGGRRNAGQGTIIGVFDTGIDPGNPHPDRHRPRLRPLAVAAAGRRGHD
jgi:hypothetical protein